MCNKRVVVILVSVLLAGSFFGLNMMPVVLFSADGVDTDSVLTQQFLKLDDTVYNFGINLKRVGASVGYITPLLMKGVVIHGGVYFDWKDIALREFNPKISAGLTVRW